MISHTALFLSPESPHCYTTSPLPADRELYTLSHSQESGVLQLDNGVQVHKDYY